jgi:hypothetical protein
LIVVNAMPTNAELVRLGDSWQAMQAAAVAPVVALPTTLAQLTLWNGEPAGGKVYLIDSIMTMVAVSAAAATGIGHAVLMNLGTKAAPTSAGLILTGLSGKAYGGNAIVAVGATVTDDKWAPFGNALDAPASQIAFTVDVPVNGLYIIRPGGMFSVACLANTVTTITVKTGIRWHEVQLPYKS